MSNFGDKVQPAVKKETKNVAIYTVVGVVVMWVGFLILHLIWPEKIPFDYRVILGGIGGGAVAVLNFFLMGMAVQKAVSETDEAGAKRRMQASYSQRNLMQMLWERYPDAVRARYKIDLPADADGVQESCRF